MRKPRSLFALSVLAFSLATAVAQTNPSAAGLPFSLNSQSSATLPSSVAVHRFSSIQTTRTVAPATGDLPNQGSAPASNSGGWFHLGTDGIGMLASTSNPAGAVVVAINTTGLSNISVSWNCKTILNQASRDNSVALQYRVGTTGNFTNVGTSSTYASAGNVNGHTSATFTETLPAAADNQAVVQVRWVYWESTSTSGSRDKIAVDDISITGAGAVGCTAPTGLSASGITTSGANVSWSAVSGATGYEYAVSTSATAPASGTAITSTSATASGLSAGTLYYLHVRTACVGSTFSSWTTTSFTTSTAGGSCAAPTGVAASGVTMSGASLSWTAVSGASSYQYALSTSATPPASGTNTTNTSITASGLPANVTFYFHVRTVCPGSTFSSWTTISFTTSSTSCPSPGGLAASGIIFSGANLSWSPASGASSYQYALSTSATPPASGTGIAGTSYAASGLTASTLYYFHVRTVCTGGAFSSWSTISFTTPEQPEEGEEFVFMTYNLLNYPGSDGSTREPAYRTIMNDVQPDILVVQEISAASGISSFLNNVLNYSSTTYSAGAFINGPDSDNGIFYKSSIFQFISNTAIPTALRDINQFKLRHLPSGDTLIIYSAHLKASNTSADEAQRAAETADLRAVTDALAPGKYFLVCGDFNIYGSSEAAYQNLVSNGANANGKFNDIISMSGTWNNSSYAIHHTQSPRTAAFGGGATGGMDDRFDMILFSSGITQPGGIDIVSSTYKAYGNDGAHFNQAINTPPYTMYTSTIASALHDASDHLPVVVKLQHTDEARNAAVAAAPVKENNELLIYPNPAGGVFYVQTSTTAPQVFFLYDSNGRQVQQQSAKGEANERVTFDVTNLAPGMYYLRPGQQPETYKIAVQ